MLTWRMLLWGWLKLADLWTVEVLMLLLGSLLMYLLEQPLGVELVWDCMIASLYTF